MHPGSARSANEIMEITNLYALRALVDTGHDEVSNWKIYALRQSGCTNNKSYKVVTHGMLHRQSNTMRCIAMMGKNSLCCTLGRWGASAKIFDMQMCQPRNFLGV